MPEKPYGRMVSVWLPADLDGRLETKKNRSDFIRAAIEKALREEELHAQA
ncbi:MAG: hypothetical protein ABC596_09770 [Candidatus Methanosuratincola petrocarbonis]